MTDVKYTLLDNNSILQITTKLDDLIIKFYIDTYCNRCNLLDEDAKNHDWVLTSNDVELYTKVIDGHYVYTIPAALLGLSRFDGLYVVSCAFTDAYLYTNIVYDMDNLYCYRYELMKNVCVPCDDIHKYSKLIEFMFAEMMFRNTVNLARYDDALGYYGTLLSIVGRCNCCSNCCDCDCGSYVKPKKCPACT
jgi:hypothetical protein